MAEESRQADEGRAAPPACLLLSFVPDEATAKRLAHALVEEGLVACVSFLPGATSVYRWQGAVQETREVVLLAKTRRDATVAAVERLTALHPYACPEVLVFDAVSGFPPYLRWLADSVSHP